MKEIEVEIEMKVECTDTIYRNDLNGNPVKDAINSFRKQMNEIENKIDELEDKWVLLTPEECGKIGTWIHSSLKEREKRRELLEKKLSNKD